MSDERHAALLSRVWQAQTAYDKTVQAVESAVRFYDRVPDGDRRRPQAQSRLNHALAVKNIAEAEAGQAADELLAYEAEHGPPTFEQPQLPEL